MRTRIEVVICDLCPPTRRVPGYKTITITGLTGGNPLRRDVCRKHAQMLTRRPADEEPEVEERIADLPCDVCKRKFVSKQALGMHRYRAHNLVGTDPATIKRRENRNARAARRRAQAKAA